jgi:hypothetical protein
LSGLDRELEGLLDLRSTLDELRVVPLEESPRLLGVDAGSK